MFVSLSYIQFVIPVHLGLYGTFSNIDLTADRKVESVQISDNGWVRIEFKDGGSAMVSPSSVRCATVKPPTPTKTFEFPQKLASKPGRPGKKHG